MPRLPPRAAREAMSVRLDVNGMIADTIGGTGVARRRSNAGDARGRNRRIMKARRAAGACRSTSAVPEGRTHAHQGAGGGSARRE